MAHATLEAGTALILGLEGGFSNHPKDPGGPTNRGVTLKTLSAWRKKACTIDDLKALDASEAAAIFEAQYATPIRYDDLPAGVDFAVYDCAVNSGPSRAAKILQQVLSFQGNDVDGIIGAKTLAAMQGVDPADLIGRYDGARLAFMQTLSAWSTFRNGWKARVDTVGYQALALSLGRTPPVSAPIDASSVGKATGPTKVLSSMNGKAAVISISGVAITAGTIATQLAATLQPLGGFKPVAYVLVACSIVAGAVPLWVAIRRAASGEAAA